MKKLTLNLLKLGIVSVVITSCGGINKMVENSNAVKYDVKPSPLETNAGEVSVTISGKFPEKYFNKKAIVVVTPVLKYEGGQTEFDSTTLQGESVEANNKVIPYAGGDFSYTGKIPYKPEMLKSELDIQMKAQIKKKTVDVPAIKIGDGVIATSTLVENDPKAILVGDKFQRVTPEQYQSQINYVINQANVRSSELKKDDIKDFQDKIKEATTDSTIDIKGAKISAYASPDGPYDFNDKLSGKREKSAQQYLLSTLKKMKVNKAKSDSFLTSQSTAEDWDGFKKLMEASNIQDKDLILRVLSMYSDPAVRDQQIKNISQAYDQIKVQVLPKLRRSQMYIDVDKIGYSDQQIADLAKNDPSKLNIEEILYAATLTKDLNEKLSIYQTAANNFPNEFRAFNDLGYVQLKLGKVDEAKASFEKAKAIDDNDVVKNNLGAVALMQGDLTTAEQLFTSAMGAGDVVNYNLGIIKIKQGDYSAAVNYFGNTPSFNAGLAHLLNNENDKAISTLGELGDSNDPMVYYLKAVAGARTNDENMVMSNLRTAVEKDPSLKAHAKKDLEFRNFATKEGFTAIVE